MLDLKEAMNVIYKNIPNGAIHKAAKHKNLYIFTVYYDDAFEGMMDPYYSVDMNTGKFSEVAVGNDITPFEIFQIFTNELKVPNPDIKHSGLGLQSKWRK